MEKTLHILIFPTKIYNKLFLDYVARIQMKNYNLILMFANLPICDYLSSFLYNFFGFQVMQ